MKRNCTSCFWGVKTYGGYKCNFPVPYYMLLKMGNYVITEIVENMNCQTWEFKVKSNKDMEGRQCSGG